MRALRMAAAVLAILGAGCGDGGEPGPSITIDPALCQLDQIVFDGDLAGDAIPQDPHPTSYSAFQQLERPYSYDVTFDGGTLHLEWTASIFEGQAHAVTGTVVMPAGAPHAGETICGGRGLLQYIDRNPGTTYLLALDQLTLGCGGTAIAGSVSACTVTAY